MLSPLSKHLALLIENIVIHEIIIFIYIFLLIVYIYENVLDSSF